MLHRYLFLIIVTIGLSACAHPYVPPVSGPTAKLEVGGDGPNIVDIFADPYRCSGGSRLTDHKFLDYASHSTSKTVTIPANQLVTLFLLEGDPAGTHCESTCSFTAEKNQIYRVNPIRRDKQFCYFSIQNISHGHAFHLIPRQISYWTSLCNDELSKFKSNKNGALYVRKGAELSVQPLLKQNALNNAGLDYTSLL